MFNGSSGGFPGSKWNEYFVYYANQTPSFARSLSLTPSSFLLPILRVPFFCCAGRKRLNEAIYSVRVAYGIHEPKESSVEIPEFEGSAEDGEYCGRNGTCLQCQ